MKIDIDLQMAIERLKQQQEDMRKRAKLEEAKKEVEEILSKDKLSIKDRHDLLNLTELKKEHQTLEESWEGLDPAPLEFFHSRLMDYFHAYRNSINPKETSILISGIELGDIIANAKRETYAKYPNESSKGRHKPTAWMSYEEWKAREDFNINRLHGNDIYSRNRKSILEHESNKDVELINFKSLTETPKPTAWISHEEQKAREDFDNSRFPSLHGEALKVSATNDHKFKKAQERNKSLTKTHMRDITLKAQDFLDLGCTEIEDRGMAENYGHKFEILKHNNTIRYDIQFWRTPQTFWRGLRVSITGYDSGVNLYIKNKEELELLLAQLDIILLNPE